MRRSKIKVIALHLCIFAVIGIYLFFSLEFRIYCPIKYITGFTCPACGSTRAMFALIRGDLVAYATYNPFALPLGTVLLLFPHLRVLGRFKKVAFIYCIAVAAASFGYNVLKIICHT